MSEPKARPGPQRREHEVPGYPHQGHERGRDGSRPPGAGRSQRGRSGEPIGGVRGPRGPGRVCGRRSCTSARGVHACGCSPGVTAALATGTGARRTTWGLAARARGRRPPASARTGEGRARTQVRAMDAAPAHGDAGGSSSNGDSQVTSEVTRRRGQRPCWLPLAFLPLACQQQTGPRPSPVGGFTTLKRLWNQGGSHFLNNVFSKMREECVKIQSHKKGTENPDIRPHRHNRPLFLGGGKVISGDPHRQVKVLHH